mmetsp:Transcript_14936/g.42212  ORF Transcript_14936/g.42212 Transcript_14936/m.42212 type:complete len:219 (+) Transcript_14936:934-1590(+)
MHRILGPLAALSDTIGSATTPVASNAFPLSSLGPPKFPIGSQSSPPNCGGHGLPSASLPSTIIRRSMVTSGTQSGCGAGTSPISDVWSRQVLHEWSFLKHVRHEHSMCCAMCGCHPYHVDGSWTRVWSASAATLFFRFPPGPVTFPAAASNTFFSTAWLDRSIASMSPSFQWEYTNAATQRKRKQPTKAITMIPVRDAFFAFLARGRGNRPLFILSMF